MAVAKSGRSRLSRSRGRGGVARLLHVLEVDFDLHISSPALDVALCNMAGGAQLRARAHGIMAGGVELHRHARIPAR
ncbi:MAG TPA: hypothetical protein VNR89_13475 [Roseomonas sp.]|nr:hypothetical protein [Roseomonas sp.]